MKTALHDLFKLIFWLWNLVFLGVVYLGILPWIGIPLILATISGQIELEFSLTLFGLIAVPTFSTLLGLWKFRKNSLDLLRLFYGIEAPLFLLLTLRFFVLRELTPASSLILGTMLLSIGAFFVELGWGYLGNRNHRNSSQLAFLQLAAHSLMLFVGLYAGLLLLYYAVPTAVVLLQGLLYSIVSAAVFLFQEFFSFAWVQNLGSLLIYGLLEGISNLIILAIGLLLFGGTATLFLGMPSALTALYIYSGQRILRAFSSQYGRQRTALVSLGIITIWMTLFISFQNQPQTLAFQRLESPITTEQQKQERLDQSEAIRKGLVHAYLASYRYLESVDNSNQIRTMYQNVFNLPEPLLTTLQNSFNQLISPFLYKGNLEKDSEKAEKLYAQFFDTSIQKGERLAIQHALKSTSIIDDAKAGVLNINQKKVWLEKQAVTVQEQGDWAEVEIYEVYQNKTNDVEEIFYSFSLPESAVITGLWLGDTNNLATRFPFTVSPRGAAQKVYNSQVRRERPVDPALLEQVGTRQYRLRAFPIPPQFSTNPDKMHLWLTYKVLRQGNQWLLPKLGEKRNIFWTKDTQRFRNQKLIKGFETDWLEASLPTSQKSPQLQNVTLEGYEITAKPLTKQDYVLPEGKRFAIVLDTSRSMGNHKQELAKTFEQLKQYLVAKNDLDLYVTGTNNFPPQLIDDLSSFNVKQKTFYGTLQVKEILRQFVQLGNNQNYDGVIVITDEGSYDLSNDKKDVPKLSIPIWLLHLGSLAPAYEDGTLKVIQDSGGGVATESLELFQRIATTEKLAKELTTPPAKKQQKPEVKPKVINIVDGYAWFLKQSTNQTAGSEEFKPIAARMLVKGLSQEINEAQLTQLDRIHAIAKTQKIVTPYSSMLVLVNDEQRQALKAAEASSDRFDRKVEDGKETLNKPQNSPVSVPEPEMTLGSGVAALFLLLNSKRKKRLS